MALSGTDFSTGAIAPTIPGNTLRLELDFQAALWPFMAWLRQRGTLNGSEAELRPFSAQTVFFP